LIRPSALFIFLLLCWCKVTSDIVGADQSHGSISLSLACLWVHVQRN
jgi:hypothetical protein